MKINEAGINLIKSFESLRLNSYLCPAKVWTIGYGHTGKNIKKGMTITEEQANDYLKNDLVYFENIVSKSVEVDLNENQFSALVSFVFNIGEGSFLASTLLKLLNNGDYKGAAEQFLRWNKSNGKVLPGLTRRRKEEVELFLKDDAIDILKEVFDAFQKYGENH